MEQIPHDTQGEGEHAFLKSGLESHALSNFLGAACLIKAEQLRSKQQLLP